MPTEIDLPIPYEGMIEEFCGLTPGANEAQTMFSNLVRSQYAAMKEPRLRDIAIRMSPYNAGVVSNFLKSHGATVQQELIDTWDSFAAFYPSLVEQYPRLELRDPMQEISERRESASWPSMREWDIERWVAAGAFEPEPYPVDPDIRARLLDLHPKLGGWLYYDHSKYMVVFAETADFLQVKVRLDGERQRRIDEEKERCEEFKQKLHEFKRKLMEPETSGTPTRSWIFMTSQPRNDKTAGLTNRVKTARLDARNVTCSHLKVIAAVLLWCHRTIYPTLRVNQGKQQNRNR